MISYLDNTAMKVQVLSSHITISPEICSVSDLMDLYSEKLELPDWFGRNWDALFDVLRNIDDFVRSPLLIAHVGRPCFPKSDVKLYCTLAREAHDEVNNRRPDFLNLAFSNEFASDISS